jgi:hypothetical protein
MISIIFRAGRGEGGNDGWVDCGMVTSKLELTVRRNLTANVPLRYREQG